MKQFKALMDAAEWNQSETAAKIRKTSNYVNMIVNGKAKVTDSILDLLKMVIANEKPDLLINVNWGGEQLGETISKQNRVAGVESPSRLQQAKGGPVKYPNSEDGGGAATIGDSIQREVDQLSEIKERDPEMYRSIKGVINSAYSNVRKKRKTK